MINLLRILLSLVSLYALFVPLEDQRFGYLLRISGAGGASIVLLDFLTKKEEAEAEAWREDIEEIKVVLRSYLKEDPSLSKDALFGIVRYKCGAIDSEDALLSSDEEKMKQALKEINLERQKILQDPKKQALADRAIDEAMVEGKYDPNTALSLEELSCIRSRMTNPDDDLIRQQIEKREIDTLDLS